MLKIKPLSESGKPAASSVDSSTAALANEFMNASVSFHKLHLKVNGTGSYSAHKTLNELYDAMHGHADDLIEGYQGACEKLLSIVDTTPRKLSTVSDAIAYIKDLYKQITDLQDMMPYSEIVNELDTAKSTLNSAKYKLTFLK